MENTEIIEEETTKSRKRPGRTGSAIILAVILLISAVLSASVLTNYAVSPENHTKTIAALDEKGAQS